MKYLINLKKEDRIIFFLTITTIGNITFSFIKLFLALSLPSLWFFINSIFLFVLSISRYYSIKDYRIIKLLNDKKEIEKVGNKNYLNNGILLIVLGVMYIFVNVYIYHKGTNTNMHPYITYLVALISFWSIGSSIYGLIKYKKNHSLIIKAVKLTNFSNALTSIMLTQIVLLDTYAETEVYKSNLINGLTGMSVGLIIIIIGLYMIIGVNKDKSIE